ncbi:protein GVQW3-like [Stegodyphus dumicola]|uniref:protein GVQW3-like n=1 Tax=Stegodyphus dumicola TaxID=202533 RepID=UPI0015B3274D|nr:protein GVQW3-like [Stegodyphus dumicola]
MASVELRINIRFCVRLGKSATETSEMLNHVYESETLSKAQTFEQHCHFREGRERAKDNECWGHPVTLYTNENIKKVFVGVHANRQQTISQIAESVGYPETTCQWILTKDLNMHRVGQHIFPLMLNIDQKGIQREVAGDLILALDKNPSLCGRIVTGDEKWFLYDTQTNRALAA